MQDTQNNHRLQGHLLGAFSVLVWGTTFVSTKVLLRTFSPIEIMIARFALGFLAPNITTNMRRQTTVWLLSI